MLKLCSKYAQNMLKHNLLYIRPQSNLTRDAVEDG